MVREPLNPLLSYAPPPQTTDAEAVREAGKLRFEFGPEPTALFLARILPWCLLLGLACGVLAWAAYVRGGWFPGVGLLMVTGGPTVWRLARYRGVPRTVGVVDGQVFYADARTAGGPMGVRPVEVKALRVQGRWGRPGVYELTTVPKLILGIGVTTPVALLYSLDRAPLDKICRELTAALWP